MELVKIVAIIILFFGLAIAMFLRKLPALLALPLMAFGLPLIAGVSFNDTLQFVIGQGALKLHQAYTIAFFGSMLSILLQKTGIAENFIKIGAELAGDKPWAIAVAMLLLITLLFTTLSGLGAIIMVATVVLPILSSIGLSPMTVVGIFLFGLSLGGIMNPSNWVLYLNVLQLPIEQIKLIALWMFLNTFLTALVYITIQLYRDGQAIKIFKILGLSLAFGVILALVIFAFLHLPQNFQNALKNAWHSLGTILKTVIGAGLALLFLYSLARIIFNRTRIAFSAVTYLSPLIPLLLIILFQIDFIAAFICGLIFAFLTTYRKGHLNLFIQSILQGGAVVMPAVVLMFGIGMLLNAIMGPGEVWNTIHPEGWPVLNLLRPLMMRIIPHSPWQYILIFTLAAPLALYRGPLNIWGMGYGLAAILLASGMPAGAIMGLLLAVGQVQGISDPTNTHNVWLANEMQVDVQKVLYNTLPYTWLIAFLGLIISAGMFYR